MKCPSTTLAIGLCCLLAAGVASALDPVDATEYQINGDRVLRIDGDKSVRLGVEAGLAGNTNTLLGYRAGLNNTQSTIVAIGAHAGQSNQGSAGVFVGYYAGLRNQGSGNMFIGTQAGYNNVNGMYNMFLGSYAGWSNADGNYNVCMGTNAGYNATGNDNVNIGYEAGKNQTTGSNNINIGRIAGSNGGKAAWNTNIGWGAGKSVVDKHRNVHIGYQAGFNNNGGNNTFIGADTDGSGTVSSSIAIGYGAQVSADHELVVGSDGSGGYLTHAYFGRGKTSAAPDDFTIHATSSSDGTKGADLILAGGTSFSGTAGRVLVTNELSTPVLEITGGADISEQFDVGTGSHNRDLEVIPGMVVSIDVENPGQLVVSGKAYDRTVAGIVSGAGGVNTGMVMGQAGSVAHGGHPVALTGRVYCKVDATECALVPGDLMTTSDTPGHAMKVQDYAKAQGSIIGKAMTPLAKGEKGLVLVLVTLQ